MGESQENVRPPLKPDAHRDLQNQVNALKSRLENLESVFSGRVVAKELAADDTFLLRLAQLFIASETIQTAIMRELPNIPLVTPAETINPVLAVPTGEAHIGDVEAAALPDVANAVTGEVKPETTAVVAAVTPEPKNKLATSVEDVEIVFASEGDQVALAAARYDASHVLFPNQFIMYVLMENTDDHSTFWQVMPNPEPFLQQAARLAFAHVPPNSVRRFGAYHRQKPGEAKP